MVLLFGIINEFNNVGNLNNLVSNLSSVGYKHVVKPALFTQSPDGVHTRLLRLGGKIQRSSVARKLTQANWAYHNEAILGQVLCGIKFANPVGLSAGFDKNFELIPLLKAIGFGFVEGGSLTLHPCAGNPRPWFHRLPKSRSLVVNAGLANQGVDSIIARLQDYPAGTFDGLPINISVAKTNSPEAATEEAAIADYIGSLRAIKQAGVGQIITINISCPNTYGGEPFTTPARLKRLLEAIDGVAVAQPIFIKMPTHLAWDDFRLLADVAVRHQVAGLTIANLAKDRGAANLADPLPDTVKGNLSGRPTLDASNQLIRQTRLTYSDRFAIIGVGGIFSAEDAYHKIRLGANVVSLITGMIFEGPQLIGQINRGLTELLRRDGFTNIAQATGADLR